MTGPDLLARAQTIAAEAGFDEPDRQSAALALTALDAWTAPPVDPAAKHRAISLGSTQSAASAGVHLGRAARSALIAALAAVIVAGCAFAASPQLRSAVAGWFGTTTVRLPYVLGSVDFLDPRDGWIGIGNVHSGTWHLYRTTDAGKTWRLQLSYPTPIMTQSRFGLLPALDLHFLNTDFGYLMSTYPARGKFRYTMERTLDGGATWQRMTPPPALANLRLEQSVFVNARDGWVMFVNSQPEMGAGQSALYRTTDGGASWKRLPYPGAPGFMGFSSPQNGWVTFADYAMTTPVDFHTVDGGLHWTTCFSPNSAHASCGPPIPAQDRRVGVRPDTGYLQMTHMDGGDFFGNQGIMPMSISVQHVATLFYTWWMYRLSPSGTAWIRPERMHLNMPNISSKVQRYRNRRQYWPPALNIAGMRAWYFADPWYFSYTLDGGHTWVRRSTALPKGYIVYQWAGGTRFFGRTDGYLWATNGNASILRWTPNGGKTWTNLTLPAGS